MLNLRTLSLFLSIWSYGFNAHAGVCSDLFKMSLVDALAKRHVEKVYHVAMTNAESFVIASSRVEDFNPELVEEVKDELTSQRKQNLRDIAEKPFSSYALWQRSVTAVVMSLAHVFIYHENYYYRAARGLVGEIVYKKLLGKLHEKQRQEAKPTLGRVYYITTYDHVKLATKYYIDFVTEQTLLLYTDFEEDFSKNNLLPPEDISKIRLNGSQMKSLDTNETLPAELSVQLAKTLFQIRESIIEPQFLRLVVYKLLQMATLEDFATIPTYHAEKLYLAERIKKLSKELNIEIRFVP